MPNDNTCDACKTDVGDQGLFHNDELGVALCDNCDTLMNLGGAARRLVCLVVTGEAVLRADSSASRKRKEQHESS